MSASELRPNLQLVATFSIRFHEQPEPSRTTRLKERIQREQILRNPPIVALMTNGDYLLLDGANRVTAFAELMYPEIPVQVVDYGDENVQLKGWHHLLLEGRALNLRAQYSALRGVALRQVPHGDLSNLLELRRVYAVLVDESASAWGLFPDPASPPSIHQRIAVLNRVIGAYEGNSRLERIKLADYSKLPEVLQSVDHQLCLFPLLTKEELLQLAMNHVLLPTGITRHLIPGRALGINLPLGFLKELPDPASRKRHFADHVKQLEMEGRIRFYEEAVFIMNE
jgi:L-serine kinase (ATP) / ParB family transcriptional regulator, heme-responsive regulator